MKLSVLQWNVWFKESADNILQVIKEADTDVVCLQELTTHSDANPNRDIPAEITALGYSAAYITTLRNADTHMGNGIFSKLPILNTQSTYVQQEDPNIQDYSHENRVYIETLLYTGSAPLTVGTVHLSYTPGFIHSEEKDRETNLLLQTIAAHKKKFVLTGDLNALPQSYTVARLQKLLVSAGPDFSEPTWTTKPFSYEGFTADELTWRLDYVFTTPDLVVTMSKTIPTEFSDHLPILAQLEL